MGLEATIQAGIVQAFEAVGDLVAEVWLTRQKSGAYDSDTGDVTTVEATYKFEAIIDEVMEDGGGQRVQGGSEVEAIDAKVYMKPTGETDPVRGDVLRIGDTSYRVVTVEPLKPGGVTVLLWQLGVAI